MPTVAHPVDMLARWTDPIFCRRPPQGYSVGFAGGLVGYIGYDAVRRRVGSGVEASGIKCS